MPPNQFLTQTLVRLESRIEIMNTRIRKNAAVQTREFREICQIPKMSTYAIGAIINSLTSQLTEDEAFVNVGLWHGFTFIAGLYRNEQKKCIGIDNFSQFGGPKDQFLQIFNTHKSPRHDFHEMDYQEYFRQRHKGPIGFYIYDGNHGYEHQLKGLQVAEPFFSENCFILIDDTNIEEVHRATEDFIKTSAHHYRLILDQKTFCNAHPTYWNGIMIFQKTADGTKHP